MAIVGGSVRTALIGFGFGGSVFHAPFIHAHPRFDLRLVVTSDPQRQAAVRARYPGVGVAPSVDDLMARIEGVDLVVVSTPNATHVPLTQALLAAGRHVVVDKPVAPSPDQVRALGRQAGAAGRLVIPFQNRRWDGDYRTVRALLDSGRLGSMMRYESRYERWQPRLDSNPARAWKRDPAGAGGILYDLGTHVIDQAVAAFGRPSSVYAEIDVRRAEAAVDDDVFVALSYDHGVRAHLWASAVAAQSGPRFRVLGTEGGYVKYGMDGQEAALLGGARPGGDRWGEEPPEAWGFVHVGDERRTVPTQPGAYQLFYSGVAAALLDGTGPPVQLQDALLTAEIVEAARQSAVDGRLVHLARD
jgi:predicted dehydrogenase